RAELRHRLRGLALALALVSASASIADCPAIAFALEPRDRVALQNDLEGPTRALLAASLRELLARLALRLVAAEDASADQSLARVAVRSAGDHVLVSVRTDRTAGAAIHYDIPRDSDALLSETLAHVILGAIDSERADLGAASASEPNAD